jgi:hypothetical protein
MNAMTGVPLCTSGISSFGAQTINQQIVVDDLILELRQLINVPVAAQVSALRPISLAGAKPNSEPGCQIRFVYKVGVKFPGHVLRQDGGNTSWMNGKAFNTVRAMINIDEFAKTIDRVLRCLIVRRRRPYELSANRRDEDQMATC